MSPFETHPPSTILKDRSSVWDLCMSELPATIVPVPFHVINQAVLSTPVSVASVPSAVVNLEGQHPPPPLQVPPEDFRINEPSPHTGPSIFSIDTNYDPSHKNNTTAKYRSKARDRYYLTQEQRKYASRAKIPSSLDDLRCKVRP